ncbi:outer membrane lipoprotein carrier protein LolA [Magnetospira sp. QH-2]|uniref:LolA family protein n=1 Tax=Magnetospira sp. (strain QH-2) TaxID=1288970 RepID=UPI0008140FA9|nr:outer membrane lipoprotein carrier protein LolA [Magnetospira sp. QH-2]
MRLILILLMLVIALPAEAEEKHVFSADEQSTLKKVQHYLNSIKTLQSRFIQATSAGGYAEGTLYLSRPGKLRFEYDPPAPFLLVADGTWLIYEDKELEQISYLLLDSTPAALLVSDDLDFNGDKVTVEKLVKDKGLLAVTFTQKENPENGQVTMILNEKPLILRQWEVLDAQGTRTMVTLNKTRTGMPLDKMLFRYKDPRHQGGINLLD